jgi:hypothetical protein
LEYRLFNLPATSLASGGYFVICANSATVANCDMDVSPDTDLIQNGAPDAVALFKGAVLIDTVSYEGNTSGGFTEFSGSVLRMIILSILEGYQGSRMVLTQM